MLRKTVLQITPQFAVCAAFKIDFEFGTFEFD